MSRDPAERELDRDDDSYDRGAEDPADDHFLAGYVPYGWPSFGAGRNRQEEPYGETEPPAEGTNEADEGTWLDEGLITLLLVAGVVLFVFPEPATSGLGILLITAGLVAWLVDWAT